MRVEKYRNKNGTKYTKVIQTTVEKINVYKPNTENNSENAKTREECKKQAEIKNEIFDLIDDYIYAERPTLELIEKLNSEERFKEYGQYFAGWIEDRNSKYKMVIKTIESEREQGKSNEEIFKKLCFNHKFRIHRQYYKKLLYNDIKVEEKEKGIEHE